MYSYRTAYVRSEAIRQDMSEAYQQLDGLLRCM
jgi:hypothetical protein